MPPIYDAQLIIRDDYGKSRLYEAAMGDREFVAQFLEDLAARIRSGEVDRESTPEPEDG